MLDFVGMIACPICGKAYGVAIDRRLKKSLCHSNIDPTNVCDDCRKKYLDGKGVMFINPETCELYIMTDEWYRTHVNIPMPKGRIVFMRDDVAKMFRDAKKKMEEEENGTNS